MEQKEKKIDYGRGIIVILFSITWLIYQIYLFNNDSQFTIVSQRICEILGHDSQMERIRGCTVLAYITSLVPIIHLYLLIILLPRLMGRQFKHFYYICNGIITSILFFLSLLVIPQFVIQVFPEMANSSLQESVKYWNIIYVNLFLAVGSLLLIFVVKFLGFLKKHQTVLKFSELFKSLIRYLFILILSICVVAIEACILALIKRYFPSQEEDLVRWLTNFAPLIMGNIAMLICAPLLEELAFRGFIFKHLDRNMPTWFAILFSSICWAIWHKSLAQFCYIFPLGILLALLYKETNRLRFPILVHFLSNFIANCSFLENASQYYGIPQLSLIKDYRLLVFKMPLENILFIIGVALIVIFVIIKILPNCSPETEKKMV